MSAPILAIFNEDKHITKVLYDSSQPAPGAVYLVQEDQPVAYASRTLTQAEL